MSDHHVAFLKTLWESPFLIQDDGIIECFIIEYSVDLEKCLNAQLCSSLCVLLHHTFLFYFSIIY